MRSLIQWFASNSVAANLLMTLVLVGGGLALFTIRPTVLPDITTGMISVTVAYPGATPAEVEKSICVRVEEQIQSVDGVKRLTSTAFEGFGQVTAELFQNANVGTTLQNIKTQVDAIDTFPTEAERPVIQEAPFQFEAVTLAISGDVEERTLVRLGERIRDDLSVLPEITRVTLNGARPWEISIEVSEHALRKHGLSFAMIANAVRQSSLDLPGGSVKTADGEILLRTSGQAYGEKDFADIALLSRLDGAVVRLGDVTTIRDGFEETESITRFDGKPAVIVQVFRVGEQDSLRISATVKDYVGKAAATLPAGVELTTWRDNTTYLEGRLDLLIRNGRLGLLLVFICLALFLRLGMALWVSIGIPISFMGAIWLMPGLDVTINMISLFGFIVVLGIVVDDAIVVGENVYRHFQQGKPADRAVKDGTIEVAVPVVFAVLTTIAAFSPLLGLPGRYGQFSRNIPLVVIACLAFSLVEALLILPAHLRHLRREPKERRGISRAWASFQGLFTGGLDWCIQHIYRPVLAVAVRWRYLTLSCASALLLICVGLVAGGHLKLRFFPAMEADNVACDLTLPRGTPVPITEQAIEQLEAAAAKLSEQLDRETDAEPGKSIIRHVMSSVGTQPFRELQRRQSGDLKTRRVSSHIGEVTLELAPSEERSISSGRIAERWRELCGPIADTVEASYTASLVGTDGIELQFTAPELSTLRAAVTALRAELASIQGVTDIADSFRRGKEEIRLRLTDTGESLGLRTVDLARQVRQAFYGEEAQRLQRGRDDVPVMVRYPRADRARVASLEEMRVRTADGAEIPLMSVADVDFGRGFAEVHRSDRQRSVTVTASVGPGANANEIKRSLKEGVLADLVDRHPGLRWTEEGSGREQVELLGGILRAFALALIVIYGMLAVVFRSYVQPMIIMCIIPFGLVGAIAGHLVAGLDLSFMSLIGAVALTGIVVNDSLVMVDFVNRSRREGMGLRQAVAESGVVRFRPIMLTSLTTCAGLTPMLLEHSLQAQFLIPTAVSLAFGVLFATIVTLVLVPCGYWVLDDLRRVFSTLYGRAGSQHDGLLESQPAPGK
ncbi:MAG: efflux RND transporter permease subunit [Planctomycetota bacterium]|nr:efflux RND transporter permease subunit [Planctomycetota bacterium]